MHTAFIFTPKKPLNQMSTELHAPNGWHLPFFMLSPRPLVTFFKPETRPLEFGEPRQARLNMMR